jgi:hypothetical protein
MRVRVEKTLTPTFSERRVDSRSLVTVDAGSPLWYSPGTPAIEAGAIFRLIPPPACSDAEVEALAARLREAGAARVKVVRRRRETVVVSQERRERTPKATAREVVMRMAAEMRTADRSALVSRLESRLSEQGL